MRLTINLSTFLHLVQPFLIVIFLLTLLPLLCTNTTITLFKSENFHTPRIEEDIPTSPDTDGLNKADNEATPDSTAGQDSLQQPLKFGTSFSKQFGVRSKSKALVDSLVARKVRRRRILNERAFWNGEDQSNQLAETDGGNGSWDVGVHRDLPYIASGYLQLAFNLSLVLVLLYIIYGFIRTIQRDVDMKVEEYSVEILGEMRECSKQYLENKCHPEHRVPAMNNACLVWERCMNRDPAVVGRARVSAETFALIINSFIEPISYKTMVVSNSNFRFKADNYSSFVSCWFLVLWVYQTSHLVSIGKSIISPMCTLRHHNNILLPK